MKVRFGPVQEAWGPSVLKLLHPFAPADVFCRLAGMASHSCSVDLPMLITPAGGAFGEFPGLVPGALSSPSGVA